MDLKKEIDRENPACPDCGGDLYLFPKRLKIIAENAADKTNRAEGIVDSIDAECKKCGAKWKGTL